MQPRARRASEARMRIRRVVPLLAAALAASLAGVARAKRQPPANPYPGYVSPVYSDPSKWLCRGDGDDVCDQNLDATVVRANGKTSVKRFCASRRPKIDCCYRSTPSPTTISVDRAGRAC